MRMLGLLMFAAFANALSQIALKSAASTLSQKFSGEKFGYFGIIAVLFSSVSLWYAMALFSLSLSIYLIILSENEISYAFPAMALSIVIATILSNIYFNEKISGLRLVGIMLLIAGSILLGIGGR